VKISGLGTYQRRGISTELRAKGNQVEILNMDVKKISGSIS
jgi:hypothetical protein